MPQPGCKQHRCPNRSLPGSQYCKDHKQDAERQRYKANDLVRDRQRFYDTKAWRDVRLIQLSIEPLCQSCKKDSYITEATEVDHIRPMRLGGAALDFTNLQSLCSSCHAKKSQTERGYKEGRYLKPVTLVCGPPGAGKSTYVEERRKEKDLVIDYDLLAVAMGGDRYADHLVPFICEAREAAIARLLRPSDIDKAWVVTLGATAKDREKHITRGAKVVMLDLPAHECKQRVEGREQLELWHELIDRWWKEYDER